MRSTQLSAEHDMAVLAAPFDQMLNPRDRGADDTGRLIPQPSANFGLEFGSQAMRLAVAGTDVLTVGIDRLLRVQPGMPDESHRVHQSPADHVAVCVGRGLRRQLI